MRILNGERIRNSFSNRAPESLMKKIWDRVMRAAQRHTRAKKNFPWKMQNLTWIWNFRTVS